MWNSILSKSWSECDYFFKWMFGRHFTNIYKELGYACLSLKEKSAGWVTINLYMHIYIGWEYLQACDSVNLSGSTRKLALYGGFSFVHWLVQSYESWEWWGSCEGDTCQWAPTRESLREGIKAVQVEAGRREAWAINILWCLCLRQ